jgi:nucleotide-binding universal stress UspA family protein
MKIMFQRILVPVDGSRYSRRAVEAAIEMAKCYQASVFLIHVIRDWSVPKEIMAMIKSGEITESRREILEDSAEIILGNAREKFEQAGLSDIKTEYVVGDPASTIVEYAKQHSVDLILIGHRGVSTHGNMIGSVARNLTNIAPVSCMLVK